MEEYLIAQLRERQYKRLILYGRGEKTLDAIKILQSASIKIDSVACENRKINSIFGFSAEKVENLGDDDLLIICCSPEKSGVIHKEIISVIKSNARIIFYENLNDKELYNTSVEKYTDLRHACEEIKKYKYISFDLFDTIIDRKPLNPQDAFQWITFDDNLGFDSNYFESVRFEASIKLGLTKSSHSEGVVLSDIYEEVCKDPSLGKYSISDWVSRELYIESLVITPNLKGVKLFNRAVSQGKVVSLISDTHLEVPNIISLVSRLGLNGPFNLFASSENGYQKADSSLFKEYLSSIDAPPDQCLHLGDNIINDFEVPRNLGFSTIYLPSNTSLFNNSNLSSIKEYHRNKYDKLSTGLIKNRLFNKWTNRRHQNKKIIILKKSSDIGFSFFGPLIVGYFCLLLKRSLEFENGVRILFCARDGFFLKKLFSEFVECAGIEKDRFELIYLKTSRRVALSCLIRNEDDLWNTVRLHRFHGTLRYFLNSRFSIDVENKSSNLEEVLDSKKNFEEFTSSVSPYVPLIIQRTSKERKAYLSYLQTIIPNNSRSILVADMGNGSSLASLSSLLSDTNLEIGGVNVCIINSSNTYNHADFIGYLNWEDSGFRHYNALFESIFTASHGGYLYARSDGSFAKAPIKSNQRHFSIREKIYEGIREFIQEFLEVSGSPLNWEEGISSSFADKVMLSIVNGDVEITKSIREKLFHDNALVRENEHRIEIRRKT